MIPPLTSPLFSEIEHNRKARRVISDNGQEAKLATYKDDAETTFRENLPIRMAHLLALSFENALDEINKMDDSEFMRMEMSRAYLAAGRIKEASLLITILENDNLRKELIYQALPLLIPTDSFGLLNQLIASLPLSEQPFALHSSALRYLLMNRKDRALELYRELPVGPFKAMLSPLVLN